MTKTAYETTPSRAISDWNGGRFEIGTPGGLRSVYPGGFIGIRIKARPDGTWDLRWFAPAHEVDFCGHATLATAHVLLTKAAADAVAPLVFHTRVGQLRVSKVQRGYRLDIPRLPPEPLDTLPAEIEGIVDEAPIRIFRNFENIFADLGSAEAVRRFVPELAAIGRLGPVGLVVTGQEQDGGRAHFVSRYFAPGAGIPEDPVTGSIHATLVPYWAERLGCYRLMAFQASARGEWLAGLRTDRRSRSPDRQRGDLPGRHHLTAK